MAATKLWVQSISYGAILLSKFNIANRALFTQQTSLTQVTWIRIEQRILTMSGMFALLCQVKDTILPVEQRHTNETARLQIEYSWIEASKSEQTPPESSQGGRVFAAYLDPWGWSLYFLPTWTNHTGESFRKYSGCTAPLQGCMGCLLSKRAIRYNLHVKYLPRSHMYIADMLSRAYLQTDHTLDGNIPEFQIFQPKKSCFTRLLTSSKLMTCAYLMVTISKSSNAHPSLITPRALAKPKMPSDQRKV